MNGGEENNTSLDLAAVVLALAGKEQENDGREEAEKETADHVEQAGEEHRVAEKGVAVALKPADVWR